MDVLKDLELSMSRMKVEIVGDEVTRLKHKLTIVREVVDDTRATAEERLAWLREYLAQ